MWMVLFQNRRWLSDFARQWLEDKNFQGNDQHYTEIGHLDMKQPHHLVVVCIRKTISNDMSQWLVLVKKTMVVE